MGKIFYLMGKSSVGKDTIYQYLVEQIKELETVVLYTTRPIRAEEKDGQTYHFVTDTELDNLERQGKIIECRTYHTVHGIWKYATADDGQFDVNKQDYLMIGTLESFQKLKTYFGEDKVVPIYIEVDDGERLTRALEREKTQAHPKYAEMCRRFLADAEDFSEANIKANGINKKFINHNINACILEIINYIKYHTRTLANDML